MVAAVAVGIGFPARLLQDVNALTLGALALGAVLWALLAPDLRGARRAVPGIAVGAAVLVVAVDGRLGRRLAERGTGRLARLGPVRRWWSHREPPVRLGRELRGDRVPGPSDRRAARPRAEAGGVLARLDARDVRGRPLDREPLPDRHRRPASDPARRRPGAEARCEAWLVAPAGRHGRGAGGRPRRRRQPARPRGRAVPRAALVPGRRRHARGEHHPTRRGVHRLELCAAPDASCTRGVEAALPGGGRAVPRARAGPVPGLRRGSTRAHRRSRVRRRSLPAALDVPPALGGGAATHRARPLAVRGHAAPGALVPARRRVPVRGAAAGHRSPVLRRSSTSSR